MLVPVAGILFGSHLLITAASGVPSLDIKESCRIEESARGDAYRQDFDACVTDEKEARDQLVKRWSEFSISDKARCVKASAYLPTYVEWLTCLQMAANVRKSPGERIWYHH